MRSRTALLSSREVISISIVISLLPVNTTFTLRVCGQAALTYWASCWARAALPETCRDAAVAGGAAAKVFATPAAAGAALTIFGNSAGADAGAELLFSS